MGMRSLRYAAAPAVLTAALALAGCGASDTVTDAAADEPTTSAGTSTPEPSDEPIPTPEPTLEPGSYPAYPADDYSYVLRLQCYCPSVNEPIAVTVTDGEVSEAVWAEKGPDHAAGDPVGEWGELTLDQIIEKANDPEMFKVLVDWEAGSPHPTKVSLDQEEMMVDEEITYLISDVQPAA